MFTISLRSASRRAAARAVRAKPNQPLFLTAAQRVRPHPNVAVRAQLSVGIMRGISTPRRVRRYFNALGRMSFRKRTREMNTYLDQGEHRHEACDGKMIETSRRFAGEMNGRALDHVFGRCEKCGADARWVSSAP